MKRRQALLVLAVIAFTFFIHDSDLCKEGEFLVNMFNHYGVTFSGDQVPHKEYYNVANKYGWDLDERNFNENITVGKALRLIMLSKGISLSEQEATRAIKKNVCIFPYKNSFNYLSTKEMVLLMRYVDNNKPLWIVKPVITEEKRLEAVNSYKEMGIKYRTDLEYHHFGDFMRWGRDTYSWYIKDSKVMEIDENGIPKTIYNGKAYYNPVTVSQFALSLYGRILMGEDKKDKFYQACDKLISMQDANGAFRFPFDFTSSSTGETYKAGWVSAMAQGHALSVFSRAYHLSGDSKYLYAGNRALYYITIPVGGVQTTLKDLSPDLNEYLFLEEYPAAKGVYTLNGFMFTMIGLYDWWQLDPEEVFGNHKTASEYFNKCLNTLKYILPYYDAGGYSVYDLTHITYNGNPTVNIGYHKHHIELLEALYSITNDEWINYYKNLWISYVQ